MKSRGRVGVAEPPGRGMGAVPLEDGLGGVGRYGTGKGSRGRERGERRGRKEGRTATSKIPLLTAVFPTSNCQDPLGEYAHLLAVERYPDPDDAGRRYPLMPPDFDPRDNVMNKEYEVFERRFRDACHFFVCDMTGVSPWPQVQ